LQRYVRAVRNKFFYIQKILILKI